MPRSTMPQDNSKRLPQSNQQATNQATLGADLRRSNQNLFKGQQRSW